MTSHTFKTDTDRIVVIEAIKRRALPFTVDIVKGRKRTNEQNRTQRMWLNEAAEQLGDRTAEELRGECKLRFGVPILRAENERFRLEYDKRIKPLPYEQKLALMMEPFDIAVTRIMTTVQKTQYLDQMHRYFAEQGVVLTLPGLPAPTPGRAGAGKEGSEPSPRAQGEDGDKPALSDYRV